MEQLGDVSSRMRFAILPAALFLRVRGGEKTTRSLIPVSFYFLNVVVNCFLSCHILGGEGVVVSCVVICEYEYRALT